MLYRGKLFKKTISCSNVENGSYILKFMSLAKNISRKHIELFLRLPTAKFKETKINQRGNFHVFIRR